MEKKLKPIPKASPVIREKLEEMEIKLIFSISLRDPEHATLQVVGGGQDELAAEEFKEINGSLIKSDSGKTLSKKKLKGIFKKHLKLLEMEDKKINMISKKIMEKMEIVDETNGNYLPGRHLTLKEVETISQKVVESSLLEAMLKKADCLTGKKRNATLEAAYKKALKWGRLKKAQEIADLLNKKISRDDLKIFLKKSLKKGRLPQAKRISKALGKRLSDSDYQHLFRKYFTYGWLDGDAKTSLLIKIAD
ncbi:hypothetical protein EOM81_09760 [bacterium]|nr:hypothetical protein [bacterium]